MKAAWIIVAAGLAFGQTNAKKARGDDKYAPLPDRINTANTVFLGA